MLIKSKLNLKVTLIKAGAYKIWQKKMSIFKWGKSLGKTGAGNWKLLSQNPKNGPRAIKQFAVTLHFVTLQIQE